MRVAQINPTEPRESRHISQTYMDMRRSAVLGGAREVYLFVFMFVIWH